MSRGTLAERMRPTSLAEFVGQQHLLAPGRALREAILHDALASCIVWGPPGCGKTSLAGVLAGATRMRFVSCSAAVAGPATWRRIAGEARAASGGTLLFVDEAHRLRPADQSLLLSLLDEGRMVLVGAASDAPGGVLSPSLLSRATECPFLPLAEDELRTLVERALRDPLLEGMALEAGVLEYLVAHARGDARVLLGALERLALVRRHENVGVEHAVYVMRPTTARYHGEGDNHHDVAIAFVKSMRGSDPDATLYWLARLLEAGEAHGFVVERMLLVAAEDVGLADPFALVVVEAAARGIDRVGLPMGRSLLAEAALYLATAPKSAASSVGLEKALRDVRAGARHPVPLHLRQRSLRGAPEPGYGQGGALPQQLAGQFLFRQYLPDAMSREVLYEPGEEGNEARIRERLRAWWPEKRR